MEKKIYRFYVAQIGEIIGDGKVLGRAQDKYGFYNVKILEFWFQ